MWPVTRSVWLSKYLLHLTEKQKQIDFCRDCRKCSCLDFDEDAINLDFYLRSVEKVQVQNGIDGDRESLFPISITCLSGRRAVQRATKSLSVEEN